MRRWLLSSPLGPLPRLILVLPVAAVAGWFGLGCATPFGFGGPEAADRAPDRLSLIVSELQLHLGDDTYRFPRARSAHGGDVFESALWRLDDLRAQRKRAPERWGNLDIVLEFARARALERLRRFSEAIDAYALVADSGSLLAVHAERAVSELRPYAELARWADEPFGSPADEVAFLDARVEGWQDLLRRRLGDEREPLAREELESWEMLRVEWLALHAAPDVAISACTRLVEENRDSKLRAKHLIRLGDLYASAARREQLRSRTRAGGFDTARYESWLDQAFSAYELAGDDRNAARRVEADRKREALLAYHRGVYANGP